MVIGKNMKTLNLTIILLIFSTGLLAKEKSFEQTAQDVLKPLKRAFQKELKTGMKKGPYDTVDICHLKAPHLSEGDHTTDYEFGRTSLKIRNESNKAKEWLKDALETYKGSTIKKPLKGKVIKVGNKNAYVEPIYIKQVCLKCHGDIKGAVKKRINKLYPHDQATGYKFGEFRGLFWLKEK